MRKRICGRRICASHIRFFALFLEKRAKNKADTLQLIVKVYNINTEKNSEILKKCEIVKGMLG